MDNLSRHERNAFLAIYSGDHDTPNDGPVIESLTRRGLTSRCEVGSVAQTQAGAALYMQLQGDEPYEGI